MIDRSLRAAPSTVAIVGGRGRRDTGASRIATKELSMPSKLETARARDGRDPAADGAPVGSEGYVDAAGIDSFPASDPPGWWAGADDRTGATRAASATDGAAGSGPP
jgi:hypothetical protein